MGRGRRCAARARSREATLYAEQGIATEVLDEQSLVERGAELRRGLAGGLLVPSDGVIYPPSAALALLARARELGAEVRERTAVDESRAERCPVLRSTRAARRTSS
jgi:glycine/D-amino acid oxidase-like deaminating enzyme